MESIRTDELAREVGEICKEVAEEAQHVRAHFKIAAQRESEIRAERSRAESDSADARMLVELAHSTGNTYLIPAEQAVRSIGALMLGGDAQFPSVIVMRSLLEWSARGGWVFEPKIDWRLRAERG